MRVLVALLIFIIGRWLSKVIAKAVEALMTKRGVDRAAIGFVGGLTSAGIMAFTLIAVLAHLGVQTASLVAVLGAAGLVV